jgi:hypothetical protein
MRSGGGIVTAISAAHSADDVRQIMLRNGAVIDLEPHSANSVVHGDFAHGQRGGDPVPAQPDYARGMHDEAFLNHYRYWMDGGNLPSITIVRPTSAAITWPALSARSIAPGPRLSAQRVRLRIAPRSVAETRSNRRSALSGESPRPGLSSCAFSS